MIKGKSFTNQVDGFLDQLEAEEKTTEPIKTRKEKKPLPRSADPGQGSASQDRKTRHLHLLITPGRFNQLEELRRRTGEKSITALIDQALDLLFSYDHNEHKQHNG